jgi:hypothetical protein
MQGEYIYSYGGDPRDVGIGGEIGSYFEISVKFT